MRAQPLDIIIRMNFLGDPSPATFFYASQKLHEKYNISVKTYETYHYMNMHSVWANAIIMYRRNSIMQHVYHKGLFKHKKYYLDVVVYADGSLVFERFKT